MLKIFAGLILVFCLAFIINCGSKKIPKDLSDKELYDSAVKEMTEDSGGFP